MALASYYESFTGKRPSKESFSSGVSEDLGSFRGFLQPVRGGENFDHFKTDEKVTDRLYAEVGTGLTYGDIITYSGIEYDVIYSLQPAGISGRGKHKEILVGRRGEGV